MEDLCAGATRGGGDYCDLFFENTRYRDLLLRDGVVGSAGYHVDYGAGIRVLAGGRTGYAYTESTSPQDLKAAAKAAGSISGTVRVASTGQDGGPMAFKPAGIPVSTGLYPVVEGWMDCPTDRLADALYRLDTLVRSKDSRIVSVTAMLSASQSEIMNFNSLGEMSCDSRPMGTLALSVVYSDGKTTQNNHVSKSFRKGAEMISPELINALADEAVKDIDARLQAIRPKGGKMQVVMGSGASGILLHEAMGHAFEADFNRKGQSVFSGRIGSRICRKGINIVDDALLPAFRGSLSVDDEGVPGQKTYMVTDGILTSYLHDRISAAYYGVSPTGNGRRESFRFAPIPRMRSTYMENGDGSAEDIIASVRHGIYVDEFSNGQVKIGEGDFTFFVKSGYLIENGKLTAPVKDINVIGNGPAALADIAAVADDAKVDDGAWTCGKEQSVPVSCGIPTVLVNNLTVGGE